MKLERDWERSSITSPFFCVAACTRVEEKNRHRPFPSGLVQDGVMKGQEVYRNLLEQLPIEFNVVAKVKDGGKSEFDESGGYPILITRRLEEIRSYLKGTVDPS